MDHAWFVAKIARALKLCEQLFDASFCRLIHAEFDGLPGVIIDRFGDTCSIQPNVAWADTHLSRLAAAVAEVTGISNILKNAAGRTRALEGLDDESGVVIGAAPEGPIPVNMNGATYMADIIGGQKTGLFFDQRSNHEFVSRLSNGARVLDVFSHVGGFGLAALAGGAASAMAVDGSALALDLATQGAAAAGFGEKFSIRKGDAFDVLTSLRVEGAKFDVIICGPPAFVPLR